MLKVRSKRQSQVEDNAGFCARFCPEWVQIFFNQTTNPVPFIAIQEKIKEVKGDRTGFLLLFVLSLFFIVMIFLGLAIFHGTVSAMPALGWIFLIFYILLAVGSVFAYLYYENKKNKLIRESEGPPKGT